LSEVATAKAPAEQRLKTTTSHWLIAPNLAEEILTSDLIVTD
jgi:hypothetical protein